MRSWRILPALMVFSVFFISASAFAADEVFRGKLMARHGNYLQVRTAGGEERKVRLSQKVIVVSRENTATEAGRIIRNSTLLISLNNGEATTIVVEEAPK